MNAESDRLLGAYEGDRDPGLRVDEALVDIRKTL